MRKMGRVVVILVVITLIGMNSSWVMADDTDLFITRIPSNVLILLDMSDSMNWDPSGNPVSYPDRKIDIARNVLFDLLDNDDNHVINSGDEGSLDTRLGYMRFRRGKDNDDGEPLTGNIKVLSPIGSRYQDIWNNISHPSETAMDSTPLAAALNEAKVYFLRDINPNDPAVECRGKYIILVTDGSDTLACSGNGVDDEIGNPGMHRRRMLTVLRSEELRDAGIKVFVIGFGAAMPERLKNTLNWVALQGGTDNPLEPNTGDPQAYDPRNYGTSCSAGANSDPAIFPLRGYAFLEQDMVGLSRALKSVLGQIKESSYFFTAPTVPSLRLVDQDKLYITSFKPNDSPYWRGSLKAYTFNENGTIPVNESGYPVNPLWENSEPAPASRKILTNQGGTSRDFTVENVTNMDLDVPTDEDRLRLVNHIRGIDSYDVNQNENLTETREWKLGDIFHSNAVVVGSPSQFFEDEGFNGAGGFYDLNKGRNKVILVGANDGMLHAYDSTNGREEWAYVPNRLLRRLKRIPSTHTYFVDSSPKVADVWFYKDSQDQNKSADEWRTVLICGLRKGGNSYFALDITNTLNPSFLWEFPKAGDTTTSVKMGQSWSEPTVGRVKIEMAGELMERWVAFVGAGLDENESRGQQAALGKAFFVLDIKTGNILWEFSYTSGEGEKDWMRHSLASAPKAVDINFDGYIDRVYIGDLGGQVWVFDVSFDSLKKKSNSQWKGRRLFRAPQEVPQKHPIYYPPAVCLDPLGNLWVFFGTGDRENPIEMNTQERFYAVKDDEGGSYPYEEKDLSDVTSSNTYNQDSSKKGWYLRLAKTEKVLAKPTVYNRLVYFTTYTYTRTSTDICQVGGVGKVYTVEYLSGGGATQFSDLAYMEGQTSDRSTEFGSGIPSAPVVTISTKGVVSLIIGTTTGQIYSQTIASIPSRNEILYWREVIP
jgi:hypothetical protein